MLRFGHPQGQHRSRPRVTLPRQQPAVASRAAFDPFCDSQAVSGERLKVTIPVIAGHTKFGLL